MTESKPLEERVEQLEQEMEELRGLVMELVEKEDKQREKHLKQFDFSEDEVREAKNE